MFQSTTRAVYYPLCDVPAPLRAGLTAQSPADRGLRAQGSYTIGRWEVANANNAGSPANAPPRCT